MPWEGSLRRRGFVSLIALWLLVAVAPGALARPRPASGPTAGTFGPTRALGGDGRSGGRAFGYLPLHPGAYARAKAAADARTVSPSGPADPAVSPSTPANVSPSWDGIYQTGLTPPDANGAVGPTRFMETVNTKFGIYD